MDPVWLLDEIMAAAESSGIGSELVANFVAMKREEWRRFSQAVTDWELNEYLAYH